MARPSERQTVTLDTEFFMEIRSLALSFVALLERTVLRGHIGIPIAQVRKRMQAEGWEPPEKEGG